MHTEAVVLQDNQSDALIELSISVEDDDGIFLSLSAVDNDMMDPVFDYVSQSLLDVTDFFTAVEKARVEFVKMCKDRGIDPPHRQG